MVWLRPGVILFYMGNRYFFNNYAIYSSNLGVLVYVRKSKMNDAHGFTENCYF